MESVLQYTVMLLEFVEATKYTHTHTHIYTPTFVRNTYTR